MSDLVSEPIQEPPDVANLEPAPSVEGVSDGVGGCLDTNTAVQSPLSTKSPDFECVKSEQDASETRESLAETECSVSQSGVIYTFLFGYFKFKVCIN